uniref:Uncharacterized protein n=1 Tax=Acrobeloides nanus TaxID=290746 RepID=A0A914E3T2_9BILA
MPSCLIHPEKFEEDIEFLTDEKGRLDGYFRDGDRGLKRYRHKDAPRFEVNCTGSYEALACSKDQWVGGIEYVNHNRQPLVLHCCSYEGLRLSQEVGMTTIGPGEALTAGEVVRNGRQISFDVIANVKKVVNDGQIFYEVAIKRMNCLPDPPEPEVSLKDGVSIKDGVSSEIMKILENKKKEPSHDKETDNNSKDIPKPPEPEISLDDGVSSEILKAFENKKTEPSHAKETENNPKLMPKPQEPEIPYDEDVPGEILKVLGKNSKPNQEKKSDKDLKHIEKSKKNKQIRKYPPSQLLPESVPTTIKPQEEQAQIEKIVEPNQKIEMPRIIIKKLPNTLLMNPKQQAAPVLQVSQTINNPQLEQVQKPIQLPQAYEQVPQQSQPVVKQQVPEPRQSTQ